MVCIFFQPDYYKDAPHFRRIGDGPEYRLEIPHAKLDFTGTYSVIATNCYGEAKAIISLQIYAKGKVIYFFNQNGRIFFKKSKISHLHWTIIIYNNHFSMLSICARLYVH